MNQQKILFIDRDGTLIEEPADHQIDSIQKLRFLPGVITALLALKKAGYVFVMVSNQDGLGTLSFPQHDFLLPHETMLRVFTSQGIDFADILICPHLPTDQCDCRKPKLGLVINYLREQKYDRKNSYVIGDRESDMQLATNMGLTGLRIGQPDGMSWYELTRVILASDRIASVTRVTQETQITATVNLDQQDALQINTGIGFFDHMLEQLAKHGGFSLALSVQGDLHIDEHHTVEDTAIVIGDAIRQALGDKRGITRFGYLLPMDESNAQVALDLCGRSFFVFNGDLKRERVGELATELVPHFFRSFADSLKATLQIDVRGENAHHMIEAMFKATGRALRMAIAKTDDSLPTTKGLL